MTWLLGVIYAATSSDWMPLGVGAVIFAPFGAAALFMFRAFRIASGRMRQDDRTVKGLRQEIDKLHVKMRADGEYTWECEQALGRAGIPLPRKRSAKP